jgi:UDP-glucuronate 4-epimerase
MYRDFTYVDDIVEGVVRALDRTAEPDPDFKSDAPDPATSNAPYRVFNIGNNQPMRLMDFIAAIEKSLGTEAKKNFMPMQPGDVKSTSADTTSLENWVQFRPDTPVELGVSRFVEWYLDYYRVNRAN